MGNGWFLRCKSNSWRLCRPMILISGMREAWERLSAGMQTEVKPAD